MSSERRSSSLSTFAPEVAESGVAIEVVLRADGGAEGRSRCGTEDDAEAE